MNRYEIAIGKEPSPDTSEDVSLDYRAIETRMAYQVGLDAFAELFGLKRFENESDESLRDRMIRFLYG